MIDKGIAQDRSRVLRCAKSRRSFPQLSRKMLLLWQRFFNRVSIASHWFAGGKAFLDAVQTGRDHGGGDEIRIGIRTTDPALDALT